MTLHQYKSDLDEIVGSKGRAKFPYRKTMEFAGDHINSRHLDLLHHTLQEGKPIIAHEIEGWLRREDAAKLYEMAYFAGGDIVELGTSRGLSAFIMAQAIKDAGKSDDVHTVDMLEDRCSAARKRMAARDVRNIFIHCAEGAAFLRDLVKRRKKFRFAFIDHSHHYAPVREACTLLDQVLERGSFVGFHDFCDTRNFKVHPDDFGVYQAVTDGLPPSFEFYGAFGCMSLYRYEG